MGDLVDKKLRKFYGEDRVGFRNSVGDFRKGSMNWKERGGIKCVLKNG